MVNVRFSVDLVGNIELAEEYSREPVCAPGFSLGNISLKLSEYSWGQAGLTLF